MPNSGSRAAGLLAAVGVLVTALCLMTGAANGRRVPPMNVPVTPRSSLALQEPSLAVDPANPRHLAIAYQQGNIYESLYCYLALSSNGGRTWRNELLVGPRYAGRFVIPDRFGTCNIPRLAYGPHGALYYGFGAFQTPHPQSNVDEIFFMRSGNGGRTWSPPRRITPRPTGGAGDFYPVIAVDQHSGRIYIAYVHNDANAVHIDTLVTTSGNGGRTFSPPRRASRELTTFNGELAVDANGAIYLGVADLSGPNNGCGTNPQTFECPATAYTLVSRDHGRRFDRKRVLTRTFNVGCPGINVETAHGLPATFCTPLHTDGYPFYSPRLAAGARRGEVFATWSGGDPQHLSHVFFARSRNGAQSWSPPHVVGIPRGRGHDEQYMPEVSVAPNGRIDVVYYDHVYYDRAHGYGSQNVYWTYSTDGGRHFSAPVALSTQRSDTSIGHLTFNGDSFGSFLGVASLDIGVLAAWTDTRRGTRAAGNQDVFFGRASPR